MAWDWLEFGPFTGGLVHVARLRGPNSARLRGPGFTGPEFGPFTGPGSRGPYSARLRGPNLTALAVSSGFKREAMPIKNHDVQPSSVGATCRVLDAGGFQTGARGELSLIAAASADGAGLERRHPQRDSHLGLRTHTVRAGMSAVDAVVLASAATIKALLRISRMYVCMHACMV